MMLLLLLLLLIVLLAHDDDDDIGGILRISSSLSVLLYKTALWNFGLYGLSAGCAEPIILSSTGEAVLLICKRVNKGELSGRTFLIN